MKAAEKRKEKLRSKWAERLWILNISYSSVEGFVTSESYIITPHRNLIHFPHVLGVVRILEQAYFNWTLCDAAAAFFEKRPSAKWLLLGFISTGIGKSKSERVEIIAWEE